MEINTLMRILLVNDSPYGLQMMYDLLKHQPALTVVGMATSHAQAVEQAQSLHPDIVLLDLSRGDESALQLIPLLKKDRSNPRVFVLNMLNENDYSGTARTAGAEAFLNRSELPHALTQSILRHATAAPTTFMAESSSPAEHVDFLEFAEHLPEMFFRYELNPSRRFSYVSPAATALSGYLPEEYYADPGLTTRLIHPEDQHIFEAVATGQLDMQQPIELRWMYKNGPAFWVEMRCVRFMSQSGERSALEGIARDITERKSREAQLQSLALFPIENPSPILRLDAEGNILYANPASKTLLEDMGCCQSRRAPECWQEKIAQALQTGRTFTIDTNFQDIVYSLFVVPIVEAGYVNLYGRDMTERKHMMEQAERRVTELEALYQSGIAFSQTFDPREIAEKIIEVLVARLAWHHVAVRVRRGYSDEIELLGFSQIDEREDESKIRSSVTRLGQGVSGWVIEHGRPVRSSDLESDPRYVETIPGMRSGLYVPIKMYDQTLGCISVESELETAFTEADERLLSTIAVQAAVAIENARSYQSVVRSAERLAVLYEAAQQLVQVQAEIEDLYRAVHHAVTKLMPAEAFTIVLAHEEQNELEAVYLFDKGGRWPSRRIPMGHGFTSQVLETGRALLIRDLLKSEVNVVHFGTEDVIRSVLAIPLRNGDKVFGVISAQSYVPDVYTEEDRFLLEMLAAQTAVVFENERLFKDLERELAERKETERTLRLQSGALEAAANAIVVTDTRGQIQWVNAAYTSLTGYALKEVVEKNPRILNSGIHNKAFFKSLWDTILSGRVWHGELVNKRKDGTLYHEEQTITPLLDQTGAITHFIGVKQDITRRKETDEKIRQQLGRLAALREIDQAIASNFDMRVSLNVVLARAIELLAVDAATVLLLKPDSNMLECACGLGFRKRDPEGVSMNIHHSYAGLAVLKQRMVQIPRLADTPDNKFSSSFLKDEGFAGYCSVPLIVKGQVIGVLEVFDRSVIERNADWLSFLDALAGQAAIAVDNAQLFSASQHELAERRLVEEKLRQLNSELEQRVALRTADLSRVNAELGQALRVKDEFLANMSHELRTPLNAVIGLSESLMEQTAGVLNEKQSKYVNTISESGRHLLTLINDILELAKIEAGKVTLNYSNVDVNHVCQSSLRLITELALKKNQTVQFHMDQRLSLVWADERRLKQMLVNLLSNAVKFTPEHGHIGLEAHADPENGRVNLTVWDTGIGIKGEDQLRLFRPFVQLDADLAREYNGTGLGLALVAEMARLHGGRVSVESTPGTGSRFTLTLPWKAFSDTDASLKNTDGLRPAKPSQNHRGQSILLIEDTLDVIMVIQDYLEHVGYQVTVARSGMEGLEVAQRIKPELILMDVQMPGMDGLETTRRLRELPMFSRTPIIAVTARAMSNDRQVCLAAGMNEYISKPVNLRALVRLIQKLLPVEA